MVRRTISRVVSHSMVPGSGSTTRRKKLRDKSAVILGSELLVSTTIASNSFFDRQARLTVTSRGSRLGLARHVHIGEVLRVVVDIFNDVSPSAHIQHHERSVGLALRWRKKPVRKLAPGTTTMILSSTCTWYNGRLSYLGFRTWYTVLF